MPNVSLPIANFIKQKWKGKVMLDYGCAKGFLVYALRLLDEVSYGYDISKYALDNCKKEIKEYLYNDKNKIPEVELIIAKDVFEHLPYETIEDELNWIVSKTKELFVIVPFGEENKYRIPEYGFDKTHIIKENEEWWIRLFKNSGFTIDGFYYIVDNIKKNWYDHNNYGNGFFFLKKR